MQASRENPASSTPLAPGSITGDSYERSCSPASTPASNDIVPIDCTAEDDDCLSDPLDLDDVVFGFSGLEPNEMDLVVFTDVEDFYANSTSITCSFILDPLTEMRRGDRIVIMPLNFDAENWENHVVASRMAFECETEESPHLLRKVTFPKEILAHVALNFSYQFCYVLEANGKAIGKSHPFIFREAIADDFVEVLEDAGIDGGKESFVMVKDYKSLLWDRCRQLMGRNADLENNRHHLEKAIKEKEQEILATRRATSLTRQQVKTLEDSVKNLTLSQRQAEDELAQMKQLEAETEHLREEKKAAEDEISNQKTRIDILGQEVALKEARIGELTSNMKALVERLSNMQSAIGKMVSQEKVTECMNEARTFAKECAVKEQKIQSLESELKIVKQALESAQATAVAYEMRLQDRQHSCSELLDKIEVLEIQNSVMKKDFAKLDSENLRLKESLEAMKHVSVESSNNYSKIADLQEQISLYVSCLSKRDEANESLNQRLLEKESQAKSLRDNFGNYKREAEKRHFDLLREKTKLLAANKDLQTRLYHAKKAWGDLYKEKRYAQTKLKRITEALFKLKTDPNYEAKSLERLSADMDALLAQVLQESRRPESIDSLNSLFRSTYTIASPRADRDAATVNQQQWQLSRSLLAEPFGMSKSFSQPEMKDQASSASPEALNEKVDNCPAGAASEEPKDHVHCPECSAKFPAPPKGQLSPLSDHLESFHAKCVCPICAKIFPKDDGFFTLISHVDTHYRMPETIEFD